MEAHIDLVAGIEVGEGHSAVGGQRLGRGVGRLHKSRRSRDAHGRCVVAAGDGDHHRFVDHRRAVGQAHGVGQHQLLALGQVVECLAARIERPSQTAAGVGAANHGARGQAQHAQQRRVVGRQTAGVAGGCHRQHRSADRVGSVHIADRQAALRRQRGMGFGQSCAVAVLSHHRNHRSVVAAGDRDGDDFAACQSSPVVVGGGDGVSQHQRLAESQVVKGLVARIEAPAQRGRVLRAIEHRSGTEAEHGQQGAVAGGGRIAAVAGARDVHKARSRDGIAGVDVGHGQRASADQPNVGFAQGRRVGALGDHRRVIAAGDGQRDGFGVVQWRAVAVGGGHGIGQHQAFAHSQVVEGLAARVKLPIQSGAGGRAANQGQGAAGPGAVVR